MTERLHEFTVISRDQETDEIVSWWLRPDVPMQARGGEHLVVEVRIGRGPVLRREYSISGARDGRLRLSVKRAAAPAQQPGVPPGVVSAYLHETLWPGGTLRASVPRGAFGPRVASLRPLLLLGCGVGITPLVLMAQQAVGCGRRVVFAHASRDAAHVAFGDEIRELAAGEPTLSAHFFHRHSDTGSAIGGGAGPLDAHGLRTLVPSADCEVYLCGPGRFMQWAYDALLDLGVAPADIHYELFGPASDFVPRAAPRACGAAGPQITFQRSDRRARWNPDARSLLDFAEELGIYPDHACRSGSCRSCQSALLGGTVEYPVPPFELPETGHVLLCCARPVSDVVIDA